MVEKELVIHSTPTVVEIAILEDGRLMELHYQKTNDNFTVGDIFLGRIRKLIPGLNAAFVDIGHPKEAFLHYTDLGPKLRSLRKFTQKSITGAHNTPSLDKFELEPEIVKTGKVEQVLGKKDELLVQILKEPISTKGPRLSCEITIPGRYMVLTPFSEGVAVSKKVSTQEEKRRLATLVESIRPKNFGVIIRTAAEGKKVADLHEEMTGLLNKWNEIHKNLHKAKAPTKLLSELDKTSSILRDLLNGSFNRIVTNDRETYQHIKGYLESISPDHVKVLSHYKGTRSVFEHFGVSRQIKSSFGKTFTLPSGAYLVIEHTEAMHVVDVNSGPKVGGTASQENIVLSVNMEAAKEIARQMRLRDIGGIIIIDFIDMRNAEHRKDLYQAMQGFMSSDRAQHTILPLSKFGLMQITRQRVRPELKVDTSEVCPTCSGTGNVNATVLVTEDIERDLDFIMQNRARAKVSLHVHPFIDAFLKQSLRKTQRKWYSQYYKWIPIYANSDFPITKYVFFDENEDEIRL
jgi:ribonuclease G